MPPDSPWLPALYGASFGALFLVIVLAVPRRRISASARWMVLILVGALLWVGTLLALVTLPVGYTSALLALLPVSIGILAPACMLNVLSTMTRQRRSRPGIERWLTLDPVLVLGLLAIPQTRDLIAGTWSVRAAGVVVWHPGWLTWVHIGYCLVLLIWAGVFEFRAVPGTPRAAQHQVRSDLAGAALPGAGAVISIVLIVIEGGLPLDRPEWMAVAFLGTAAIGIRSFYTERFTSVVPIARGVVLDRLPDAVLIFDLGFRLTDLNPAARDLLAAAHAADLTAEGTQLGTIAAALGPEVRPSSGQYRARVGRVSDIDLRVKRVTEDNRLLGYAVLIRDVSAISDSQRNLALANRQLLDKITTIDALRRDLAEQAERDSMTGLFNRRRLDKELARILDDPRQEVAITLIDVDRFTNVNDTYGRLTGDEVLVGISDRLSSATFDGEMVVRYGGEEFIVLSPIREPAHAHARARRMYEVLTQRPICTGAGPVHITVSAGVAYSPDHGRTGQALLAGAGQALNRAKQRGRNRIDTLPVVGHFPDLPPSQHQPRRSVPPGGGRLP